MSFKRVLEIIEKEHNFILTGHETPDPDAYGACAALHMVLLSMGKRSRIMSTEALPSRLDFIFPTDQVFIEPCKLENTSDAVMLILDTNETNIGEKAQPLLEKVKDWFVVDHHDYRNNMVGRNFIMNEASSTCEILCELFEKMAIQWNKKISTALYAGIAYDTGSFIYPKTSAKTFYLAYKLVERGVEPTFIHRNLNENNSSESLYLQKMVINSLELFQENRIAVLIMTREMLSKSGAEYEDAAQLINIPLQSKKVEVSLFFKENERGILRCSLRSKGGVDVSRIARNNGGGGHKTAAGFICSGSIDKNRRNMLKILTNSL